LQLAWARSSESVVKSLETPLESFTFLRCSAPVAEVKRMVDPSALHVGLKAPATSFDTGTALPPAAGIVKICDVPERAELKAIVDPSGLHAGAPSGIAESEPVESAVGASKVTASNAGAGTLHSLGVPLRLLTKTIVEPSGDSAG
jgi:hypothetical protein